MKTKGEKPSKAVTNNTRPETLADERPSRTALAAAPTDTVSPTNLQCVTH